MKAMLYRNFLLSKSILYLAPLSLVATLLLSQIPLAVCVGTLNMVSYYYIIMLFAHEERDNGLAFNKALPIKNSIIVASYYVSLFLFLLYGVAVQGIGSALCHAVDLGFVLFNIKHVTLAFAIAMIVSAIEVPLIIHFGEKNMRLVLMLIFFAIFLLIGTISDIKVSMVLPSYLFVVCMAIFVLLISYAISTHLYRKKEAHPHRDCAAVRLSRRGLFGNRFQG